MSLNEIGCNGTATNSRGVSGRLVTLRLPGYQKVTAKDSEKVMARAKRAKDVPKAAGKREPQRVTLTGPRSRETDAKTRHQTQRKIFANFILKANAKAENPAPRYTIPRAAFTKRREVAGRAKTAPFHTNSLPPPQRQATEKKISAAELLRGGVHQKGAPDRGPDRQPLVFVWSAPPGTVKRTMSNMSRSAQNLSK